MQKLFKSHMWAVISQLACACWKNEVPVRQSGTHTFKDYDWMLRLTVVMSIVDVVIMFAGRSSSPSILLISHSVCVLALKPKKTAVFCQCSRSRLATWFPIWPAVFLLKQSHQTLACSRDPVTFIQTHFCFSKPWCLSSFLLCVYVD